MLLTLFFTFKFPWVVGVSAPSFDGGNSLLTGRFHSLHINVDWEPVDSGCADMG